LNEKDPRLVTSGGPESEDGEVAHHPEKDRLPSLHFGCLIRLSCLFNQTGSQDRDSIGSAVPEGAE
jgi:hypothetical protein